MSDLSDLSKEQLIKLVQDQEQQIADLRVERLNIMVKVAGQSHTIQDLRKRLRGAKG